MTKKYIYEYGDLFTHRKVLVADGECLVCKHCTDVWWEYSNGPYMVCCEYSFINEDGDEEDLSNNKEYGVPCNKYEYDDVEREVTIDEEKIKT